MGGAHRHDVDFYGWTQEQASLLRAGPSDARLLDLDNLAEEVEDMGRSEIREVASLLRQTLLHLIKIAITPDAVDANHWFDEVVAFQGDAVLAFSPGLRQRVDLQAIWKLARNGAIQSLERSGVSVPLLPESCPLTLDELLDAEFDVTHAVKVISDNIQANPSSTHRK